MAEIDEEALEQEQDSKAGIVMIDSEYYFKIQARQYVFGRVSVIKSEKSERIGEKVYNDMLFPSSIEGVFKLYFKYKQADLTAGKRLTIGELLEVVNEVRATINEISKKLQVD